jgi:hypothetical protein
MHPATCLPSIQLGIILKPVSQFSSCRYTSTYAIVRFTKARFRLNFVSVGIEYVVKCICVYGMCSVYIHTHTHTHTHTTSSHSYGQMVGQNNAWNSTIAKPVQQACAPSQLKHNAGCDWPHRGGMAVLLPIPTRLHFHYLSEKLEIKNFIILMNFYYFLENWWFEIA